MELNNIKDKPDDLIKIDNVDVTDVADMPSIDDNTLIDKGNNKGSVSESTREGALAKTMKHSVSYLAGGIWKDSAGVYWCRDEKNNCISHNVFTDDELNKREDIKYMIQYGAMKDLIIE